MISDRHKVIFVHLRRTGGNSIEHALGGIELLDESGRPTEEWDNRLHRGRSRFKIDRRGHYIHDTAPEIRDRFPEQFESYFKFSIVRNPWAQMASHYLKRRPEGSRQDFPDYLEQFTLLAGTVPRRSLFDDDGRELVDYVGRYESLDDDFAAVCGHLGVEPLPLPRHNTGGGTDYRSLYDARATRLVEQIFAEDIARYGYAF